MSNSLTKKFFEYAIGSGLVLLLGFISSPINTRLFSPEEFGKYSMFVLFYSIIGTIGLLGYDQSFVRFFYDENVEARPKLLWFTLKNPLLLTIIISLIIGFYYDYIMNLLFEYSNVWLFTLVLFGIFTQLIGKFVFSILRMEQKGRSFSVLQIIQKILTIVLTLVFYFILSDNFIVLILAFIISNIIIIIIGIVLEKRYWTKISYSKELKTSEKELFKFGFPLLFTFLMTWIFQSADRFFIKFYNDYYELGIYVAAFLIISILNSVQGAFSMFWIPVAYEKFKNNPEDRYFFESVSKLVALVMLVIGVLIILFKDIVILILGNEYRESSFIIPFLVLMPIMYCVSETTVIGINFRKKSKYHILISAFSALVNIVGNLLLVPDFGAKGAAISTGLSYVIFYLLRTWVSKSLYSVDYGIKSFLICTMNLIAFALYASFYKAGFIYIILGIENLIVIFILYRKEILSLYHQIFTPK